LDWEEICPKIPENEIYLLGNPPYLGARKQDFTQKSDIEIVFNDFKGRNGLDYISCWFLKGSNYIRETNSQFAFVSTNSICQGNQVSLLWPLVFSKNVDISFAHKTFKWTNNAKDKAGVAVVIIGLKNVKNIHKKYIFNDGIRLEVQNISPYLTPNSNLIIYPRNKPLRNVPEVVYGNQAIDGGYLTLSEEEKEAIVTSNPSSLKFIRKLYGGNGMLNGISQWCIWVSQNELDEASQIDEFKRRFKQVYEFRLNGGDVAQSLTSIPYRFRYIHEPKDNTIMIPSTSTEDRIYLPVEIKFGKVQTLHSVQVIYDAEIYILSFLLSKIHFLWVKSVAGGLETRIGYSNTICYNTFPFPNITDNQKSELEKYVYKTLEVREYYSEKTLAQLYDPVKMPDNLLDAHHQLDLAVERCYRSKPFESDEERLEYLFKLYEQMIEEEKSRGTLFEMESKPKKKKK
jgi:hypothetical protein